MNLKTTLFLLVLVVGGGVAWYVVNASRPPASASPSQAVLEELTPDRLTGIRVAHGKEQLILDRSAGGGWTMPGHWPTRQPEAGELAGLLGGLRSRFAPLPAGDDTQLAEYGLKEPVVTVTVKAGDSEHRLAFGEPAAGEEDRFWRPTYLRIDDQPEVLRLAPGLVALLNRPPEYYMQRRLFPAERVKKETGPEKADQLAANSVTATQRKPDVKEGPATEDFTLTRAGEEWRLIKPYKDLPDPDKLKSLLTAVPDLWVEQFVAEPDKDLAKYGLDKPEQTLRIVPANGEAVTLLIGKHSQTKTRTVTRPPPMGGPPGMPRMPTQETVHDEYRYAKLENNNQVFEIKADKLKDIFLAADALRDARLARFNTSDAKRVELAAPSHKIVLVKDDFKWRLEEPIKSDAESSKVTELLDKLSGLSASGGDVLAKADLKAELAKYGLDKPTETVTVTAEETKGEGDAKTTKTKTFTVELGKPDADKKKVAVRVKDRDPIELVDDSVVKLVERPALAYRGRKVFPTSDLAKVEVQHGGEKFALEKDKEKFTWRLTAPVQADTDAEKARKLADDLGTLEATEYVTDTAKPEDLDKLYGLAKPALSATVTYTKDNKPESQTLQIGKQREGKPEYFAKLASAGNVFVVKKELRDALEQNSLAYRPQQLWQLAAVDLTAVRVDKAGADYRLSRDGTTWKISGPFDAPASAEQVKTLVDDLAKLKAERYETHVAKDLGAFGLDKPYLRLAVATAAPKKEDAAKKDEPKKKEPEKEEPKKDEPKERVLLIGKPTAEGAATRFAKLGDAEAVFVVSGQFVATVDKSALDLLDRTLLALDIRNITQVKSTGAEAWTADRHGDRWQVEANGVKFPADGPTVADLLGVFARLQAVRFEGYGPKADLAGSGLDKPHVTVTVTLAPAKDDKAAKPATHTAAVGTNTHGNTISYFARVDNGPAVAVLNADTALKLQHSYLDFVDRSLLKLDASRITGLQRHMGNEDLELVKRDGGWQLLKPADLRADDALLDDLATQLANLRAQRIAAYPAKDLKPFGLDAPAAVWKLRLAGPEGKAAEHTLRIGNVADGTAGDHYAAVDSSTAVAVLPAALCKRLMAAPLQFRDRSVARLRDADKVLLERGERKAVFDKVDGTWKMTAPVSAEAEHSDLEEFINALTRLKADEWVAEKPKAKPADLKEYGLDQPQAHWRVQSEGKDELDLLIGKMDGSRSYAKLAAGDLVFLLDPKLTERGLAEYRSRKVWQQPLDSAQIDRLHYAYLSRPFTLEKAADGGWHVPGKPGATVNADTVRETLVALADLKAERYVTDKAADLALYGLKPPQLDLEIQTPSGKRQLHIGRMEDGSKRYYARVPSDTGSEVFLISEADAEKIVRDLRAFGQGPAKPSKTVP
jgi:hypothetical protein